MNIGNHFLFKSCLSRQPGTSPSLQEARYATVLASTCTTERVRFAEGCSFFFWRREGKRSLLK